MDRLIICDFSDSFRSGTFQCNDAMLIFCRKKRQRKSISSRHSLVFGHMKEKHWGHNFFGGLQPFLAIVLCYIILSPFSCICLSCSFWLLWRLSIHNKGKNYFHLHFCCLIQYLQISFGLTDILNSVHSNYLCLLHRYKFEWNFHIILFTFLCEC